MKNNCFLLLAFVAVLLGSCTKSNEISVSSRNFDDEIALTQNLVFTFNKNIVSPEAFESSWNATPLIEFEPKVAGSFKWTSPNELVFSPAQSFAPATQYKARLSDVLVKKTKEKLRVSSEVIAFHTPYLALNNPEVYWTRSRNSHQPIVKVKIPFNYGVNSTELAPLLKITVDGNATTIEMNTQGTTENIPISLVNVPQSDGELPLSIRIEKGLKVPNTTFSTTDVFEDKAQIPSPRKVEIVGIQTGFDNNKGYVRVVTTQELAPENIESYFSVVPAVNTKTELTDNGFIIHGDFNETDTYSLTLTTQLKGILGVLLSENQSKDLYFGKMPANIAFANKKAVYLSSKGNRNVGVSIVNVPEVQIKVAKLYENNILEYMRSRRYRDYSESETAHSSYIYEFDESQLYSDLVVNKTITTENLPHVQGVSVLNLSLPEHNGIKGLYLVNIASKDDYYQHATKVVSVSDIGLLSKQSGDDEIMIFAHSIHDATPLKDVALTLISSNNQQIYTLTTDAKGVAIFKNIKEKAPGFAVAMITARLEEDFNYLLLEDTAIETSRFEVEGKRNNEAGLDAFIYGDRDIYRPAETIHFNAILRKNNWESVGEIPVKIKFLMPNGKEYKSFLKQTDSQGAVETNITLESSAVTGIYTIEIYNGNNVLLSSKAINVEEFMPDRIKVDIKANAESYHSGEQVTINATALNLFGPPAADRTYEMEFMLHRKPFQPSNYRGYTFDIANNTEFNQEVRQGVTNTQGVAAEQFILPATYQDMGILEGKVYVTVFDETGRPVNRLKRFDVVTQPVFYGIAMPDTYVNTNAPISVPLVALTNEGKPIAAKARVEVVRFDYQTIVEKADNQLRYSSKKQTKIVYARAVTFMNGTANISYAPTVSGEYEVRVYREGAKSWTAQSFYAYGWGNTQNSSFEVNNEGQVLMEFDKEHYQVGDKANVLFKTPFAGKLLVTIERDKVLEYRIIETDKKSAEMTFNIGVEYLPNVYVSATLIRAMDNSDMPLTVAHGYAPLLVETTDSRLPVEIVAIEKSRSKTKQKITIKTQANAHVTIAVVDEGILQLKNFKTPDIHGYFYQKRALEVKSHDLYQYLLPELSIARHSSTGGDGYDLERRINPLSNGRVKLVALWSGIQKTNSNGETTFELDVPQFSGDLRIMVVAYKDDAFGSASRNMKIADPLVLSTSLPRFASPNDELVVPVNITNTTKQTARVTATIALAGNLTPMAITTQTLVIAPEKEGRTEFYVKALQAVGNATVTIKVSGLNEKFTDQTEITVRPPSSLIKTSFAGSVMAGQNATLNFTNDFIPHSVRNKLLVSRSPMVQFGKILNDLLGYPHGCLEQTVSKAFPQLYFADVVKLMQDKPYTKTGESDLNPTANIQAAILKLETLQLYNGGLSMWQAGDSEYWWGTAYAAHFLGEAQKAGFEVNPSLLSKIIDYLHQKTNAEKATEIEVYRDVAGSRIHRTIARREMLYSLYVLASMGKPNRSMMNYYKQNTLLLSADERYLLATAYQLMGDRRSYVVLLPKEYALDRSERMSGESLSSPIRNMALVLNSLLEADPNNIQIPAMARRLSEIIKTQENLSTQEQALAMLALGKIAKKANTSTVSGMLMASGQNLATFTGQNLLLTTNLNGKIINFMPKGLGVAYYFGSSEGLKTTGKVQEEDHLLQVRRSYFSRNGQAISTLLFKQNQLIVVRIAVTTQNSQPVENVVITDMLPAGFEIENPRLSPERDMAWLKNVTQPQHFDIRDDRISFFTNIGTTPQYFYYLVRVVSRGKFVQGVVSADAMYNPDYRSYNGAGIVKVE